MSAIDYNANRIICISKNFSQKYPGASVGILILDADGIIKNPGSIQEFKMDIELGLKRKFSNPDILKDHPTINSYNNYYRNFKKTYHVLAQIDSVVFKGRPIQSSIPLLEIIFTLELKNLLLTAIHDLDALQPPLQIGIASGEEAYITLSGKEQRLKSGDMFMRDQMGVISSVIYGPDRRTRIKDHSTEVLIVVYAPDGIRKGEIIRHFGDIKTYLRLISPQLIVKLEEIYPLH